MVSLCQRYETSLTQLFTIGWPISSFYMDIPKIGNGQFQKMEA
jgi:hypothetical protein